MAFKATGYLCTGYAGTSESAGIQTGIPLEVLEYCIGQSMKSNRPIFNYVKIMSQHADAAIAKIMTAIKASLSVTDEDAEFNLKQITNENEKR